MNPLDLFFSLFDRVRFPDPVGVWNSLLVRVIRVAARMMRPRTISEEETVSRILETRL